MPHTLSRLVGLLLLAALTITAAAAGSGKPRAVGEHLRDVVLQTPHPYPVGKAGKPTIVWTDRIHHPGARYLVLEFARFDLAPGDRLEVRDPKGEHEQIYRGRGYRDKGGDFITKMIPGDEAILELHSGTPDHDHYGYRIERVSRGYTDAELLEMHGAAGPEALCGLDDQEDAICYEATHPEVYERSRPVVMVLMDGVEICTAWLASCENHLITASHCTWGSGDFDSQAELDRMEFRFLYQETTCGGAAPTFEHSFLGGTWLENDHDLDYTLIQAPAGEDPATAYGWLRIDDRLPDVDEPVYIVGHPVWGPKKIGLFSSHPEDQDNPDAFCEVYSLDEPACIGGTVPEIGYYCDTQGGESGAPVLSHATGKVVALHHCADCPNRGVRIQEIWSHNQAGAHPMPACSLYEDVGVVKLDAEAYRCDATAGVQVTDGSLPGAGTQVVTAWSGTEATLENVTLTETGAGTGVFTGALNLTASPPQVGNGLVSVAHGDILAVQYIDADDGQGGVDVPRTITASVDCLGPAISGLEVVESLGTRADVLWSTDEPAAGQVYYSASPPAWSGAATAGLTTTHETRLEGLTPCTDYAFFVQSADSAGNETVEDNGGSYHAFATGLDVEPTYVSDRSETIRDNRNAVSTLQVNDDEVVLDVNVTVNITHTYLGDVEIYLMGPNGVEIDLSSDNGGAALGYTGTVFDDEADLSILEGLAPYTGSFRPEQPLSVFDGINAAGHWTLRVFDDADGNTGTLDSWSLQLLYPARPCGPQAAYDSHVLSADDCVPGEPGHDDGIGDAGEEVSFLVTLRNDGTDPVTGITGTAMPLTSGVVVTGGTSAFPDLAPGGTATSLSAFTARVPSTLPCGMVVDFRIDIAAAQGTWAGIFHQAVGLPLPGGGTVLDETFDGGIPATWAIVDGGTSSDTWFADDPGDPLACGSINPAPPIAGIWAAVNSDCAEAVDMDESLITPVLDLSPATTAAVEFDHYFNRYEAEVADLDVRSSLTGGAWVTVGNWAADTPNPQHEWIDISLLAAGAADVQLRWRYHNANFEWYWYVDNVRVTYTSPDDCQMTVCTVMGPPPGEQTGAHWAGAGTYAWDADPQATGGYLVYRGTGGGLQALTSAAADSCLLSSALTAAVNLAGDDPGGTGEFVWYLVTGWSDAGEGTAGGGTLTPRQVNTTGPCEP